MGVIEETETDAKSRLRSQAAIGEVKVDRAVMEDEDEEDEKKGAAARRTSTRRAGPANAEKTRACGRVPRDSVPTPFRAPVDRRARPSRPVVRAALGRAIEHGLAGARLRLLTSSGRPAARYEAQIREVDEKTNRYLVRPVAESACPLAGLSPLTPCAITRCTTRAGKRPSTSGLQTTTGAPRRCTRALCILPLSATCVIALCQHASRWLQAALSARRYPCAWACAAT
jgi:hypothetical protein